MRLYPGIASDGESCDERRYLRIRAMHTLTAARRAIAAAPVVSALAILSLALGIGANSAIFSIVDGLMLRTLPVERPDRLAVLGEADDPVTVWPYPVWEQIRSRPALFRGAAAWWARGVNLAPRGRTDVIEGLFVSGTFFETLGVRAGRGRMLVHDDDRAGAEPVVVISDALWKRRFAATDDAVGTVLTIEGHPHTIVGVTPPGFFGLEVGASFDVAIPLASERLIEGPTSLVGRAGAYWLTIAIRLADQQSEADALNILRALHPSIRAAAMPPEYRGREAAEFMAKAFTLQSMERGLSGARARYGRPVVTLLVVVALVLLIACANLANLLLARADARRHEMSVRLALGASRSTLVRQLACESLLLAGGGALLGLAVATAGGRLLVSQLSAARGLSLELSLDWRVLTFTAIVAIATAAIVGTIPAWQTTRVRPNDALKRAGRTVTGVRTFSTGNVIVVAQVALCMMLVVAGGLFLRTFIAVNTRPIGLDRGRIAVARVQTQIGAADTDVRLAALERFRRTVAEVPGVEAATLSSTTPAHGQVWQTLIELPDGPPVAERDRMVWANLIGADYFTTFGTTIIAGRQFTTHDSRTAPSVAIVNTAFVAKYFGGRSPLGARIHQPAFGGRPAVDREIVGWVDDVVYLTPRESAPPVVYLPIVQRPQAPPVVTVSARATGSAAHVIDGIAAAIAQVDGDASVTVGLLDDQLRRTIAQERLVATIAGFFGVLALLLAALGLYGVTAYGVSRRRIELGIRLALGSRPSNVVTLVLGRVAVLVSTGLCVGTAVSLWASRFVESLLYGIEPRDPLTLIAAALVLVATSGVAAWLPARRAGRIDPASLLRDA
jgi:putative ABC transport system permease protein